MNRAIIVATAATLFLSMPAAAQSSKFAAMWEEDDVFLASAIEFNFTEYGSGSGYTGPGFEDTMAMIKAPQGKELLIGVSGVANLLTLTEVKGKNGEGWSEALAGAGIWMSVAYMPADEVVDSVCNEGTLAAPGWVPMSTRIQRLGVNVDLDVVDVGECTEINGDGNLSEGECLADLLDIEGSVSVFLGLDTSAAHHFNFVAADLPRSTTYQVAACFAGDAIAEIGVGVEAGALATAAIGKRMVTVQEVRAVKGAFEVEMD